MTRSGWITAAAFLLFLAQPGCVYTTGAVHTQMTGGPPAQLVANRCTYDGRTLMLTSQEDPLWALVVARQPAATAAASILAGDTRGAQADLLELGRRDGSPLHLDASRCRRLDLEVEGAGFTVRINGGPRQTYVNVSLHLECEALPDGRRVAGSFSIHGCRGPNRR
jgi:hypothetical protein